MLGEEGWRQQRAKQARQALLDPRRHSLQVSSAKLAIRNGRGGPAPPAGAPPPAPRPPQHVPAMMQHADSIPLAIVGLSPRRKISQPVRTCSHDQQARRGMPRNKDCFDSSSSSSSTGASYMSHHRHTLPHIMTTGEWPGTDRLLRC